MPWKHLIIVNLVLHLELGLECQSSLRKGKPHYTQFSHSIIFDEQKKLESVRIFY